MANQNLTGYPSIDKPWLKYYSEEDIHAPLPKCSAYEFVYKNNQEYLSNTAINYYGRRISYGEMFREIDNAAKAFYAAGVRKGDIVIVCTVNMPETVYTLYGLNRLGAVVNLTDPRTNPDAMREYINECQAKLVVTVDLAYPLMKKAVAGSTAEKIVLVSPSESLSGAAKMLYKLKNKAPKIRDCDRYWGDFIKQARQTTPEYAPYSANTPFVMAHTGGTTGISKTVVLSDDNLNAVAHCYFHVPVPLERGHKYLNDLPPFIIYGLCFALHTTLCRGLEVILYPVFDSQGFPKLFAKYKPNHFCAVPDHLKYFSEDPILQKMDMSFLITVGNGGDSLDTKLEKRVNEFLSQHNCKFEVLKGYGMSELGAVAISTFPVANAIGSVGIPLIINTMKIVDTETGKELPYNQTGEIWISGPSMMIEYYKNPAATAETIVTDEKGIRWIRTGDLGRITEEGLLFHEGRLRRIYLTDYDNQPAKIFPMLVEEKIKAGSPAVENCCVVGRLRKGSACYEVVAYVVAPGVASQEAMTAELRGLCESSLPTYMQPVEYRYIDELPHTPIGKVDFRKLEEMAAGSTAE